MSQWYAGIISSSLSLPSLPFQSANCQIYACFQCPIQTKLVALGLLTPQERDWINAYHAETLEKVSPLLQNDPRALAWLKRECSAI